MAVESEAGLFEVHQPLQIAGRRYPHHGKSRPTKTGRADPLVAIARVAALAKGKSPLPARHALAWRLWGGGWRAAEWTD